MESWENKPREDAALPTWRRCGKNMSFLVFVQKPSEENNEASFPKSLDVHSQVYIYPHANTCTHPRIYNANF